MCWMFVRIINREHVYAFTNVMCINIVVYVSLAQSYMNILQMKFILLQWKMRETWCDCVMSAFDSLFLRQMNDIRWTLLIYMFPEYANAVCVNML